MRPMSAGLDEPGVPTLPPVFDVPPHLEHRDEVRVWFVEPLGVVTQLPRPLHAKLPTARFFSEVMDPALHARKAALSDKLYYVHDWRNLMAYDTETRKHLTDWGISVRKDIRGLEVVLGDHTPSITRMGINVAASGLRMVGIDLRLSTDIHEVIQRLGLRPAA